jgi:hypothetical protein
MTELFPISENKISDSVLQLTFLPRYVGVLSSPKIFIDDVLVGKIKKVKPYPFQFPLENITLKPKSLEVVAEAILLRLQAKKRYPFIFRREFHRYIELFSKASGFAIYPLIFYKKQPYWV